MTDITHLVRALERRDELSDVERSVLLKLPFRVRSYEKGQTILTQGQRVQESCLLTDGFITRSSHLENGSRPISAIQIAGDFVDLHGMLLEVLDHDVVALGRCTVGFVKHEYLRDITREHAQLGRLLWMLTVIDAAIVRAWVTSFGGRSSRQQLAHLFCELFVRLRFVGEANEEGFSFPGNQNDVADMMGLSVVHLNRTLQGLRAAGLVEWRDQRIRIPDFEGLATFAEFDPTYLSLGLRPR